jgi:hypothetical protein
MDGRLFLRAVVKYSQRGFKSSIEKKNHANLFLCGFVLKTPIVCRSSENTSLIGCSSLAH